ncbi:MAG: invasion associated locus B family protein [Xanthobacteraceae bacterium]
MPPMRFFSILLPLLFAAILAAPAVSSAQTATGQAAKPQAKPAAVGKDPVLLGQYGDWGAYSAAPDGKKICFALAQPASSKTNPPNRPRDPIYFFISTRPAENVKEEVSVAVGYPLKPDSEAKAEIDSAAFAMYTQDDGAWVKSADDEAKLIDAMRKGADLTIKGTSSRGTQTTDTYSLKGVSQALERVEKECN